MGNRRRQSIQVPRIRCCYQYDYTVISIPGRFNNESRSLVVSTTLRVTPPRFFSPFSRHSSRRPEGHNHSRLFCVQPLPDVVTEKVQYFIFEVFAYFWVQISSFRVIPRERKRERGRETDQHF